MPCTEVLNRLPYVHVPSDHLCHAIRHSRISISRFLISISLPRSMITSSTPNLPSKQHLRSHQTSLFVSPKAEHSPIGLPPWCPPAASSNENRSVPASSDTGTIPPLMYLKDSREVCFGLNSAALRYQGLYTGVTTSLAIHSLAALVDDFVI